MHDPSISPLTYCAITLLVACLCALLYDWVFRYRRNVQERVQQLSQRDAPDPDIQLFKDLNRTAHPESRKRSIAERASQLLEQAGLACTLTQFACGSALAGLIFGGVGFLISPLLGIVLLAGGAATPSIAMALKRRARRRKLSRQLPEAFQMISRAVRSGQTIPAALKIIADDFDPPISEEFLLCYEQQNLGMSKENALRKLAERAGVMELQIFVVALLVQAKSGGNLVELLDNLALTIRKRLKLADRVHALTGEWRMQAIVILTLPIASLAGLFVLCPDYAAEILAWPKVLAFTAAAQAAGTFWIRRIINIKY